MEKLDDVLNHVHISHSEKQRLLSAIKQVKADQVLYTVLCVYTFTIFIYSKIGTTPAFT